MDRRDYIKLALLSVSMVAALAWGQNPVVKVEGGMIQGVPSAASGVTVFRGIPYAAPPVGDLRWKRPQPVVKWKGVNIWECRNCGHIVIGTEAPDVCPVCFHPQAYFEINAENY